jgi:hypothetical protein
VLVHVALVLSFLENQAKISQTAAMLLLLLLTFLGIGGQQAPGRIVGSLLNFREHHPETLKNKKMEVPQPIHKTMI